MAFTLAHPAAVLPLRKLPLMALLPLVIGSVIPDLIPWLPFGLEWHLPNTHSWHGLVLIDLPAGLLLLLLLQPLRRALAQPLWEPHRTIAMHAINDYFSQPRWWLSAIPSLLAGSLTHLLWDRLTHESHWTTRNLPQLYQPLFPEATHELPLYHFLQYATSVIGLIILAWQYWLAVRRDHGQHVDLLPLRNQRLRRLALLLCCALLLGVIRLWLRDTSSHGTSSLGIYPTLSLVLKTTLASFALLYLATGLIMQAQDTRTPPP